MSRLLYPILFSVLILMLFVPFQNCGNQKSILGSKGNGVIFPQEYYVNPNQIVVEDMRMDVRDFKTSSMSLIGSSEGVSSIKAFKMDRMNDDYFHFNAAKWADGTIPYEFDASFNNQYQQKQMVIEACKQWSKWGNIRCVPREQKDTRYLKITKSEPLCRADVGAGRQNETSERLLVLGGQCWSMKTLIHEFGHVIGLIHEHQREDRDLYVSVDEPNVQSGRKSGFRILSGTTFRGTYDFDSIMHYSSVDSQVDSNKLTITPRFPPYSFINWCRPGYNFNCIEYKNYYESYSKTIGQSSVLSFWDKATVASIYNPNGLEINDRIHNWDFEVGLPNNDSLVQNNSGQKYSLPGFEPWNILRKFLPTDSDINGGPNSKFNFLWEIVPGPLGDNTTAISFETRDTSFGGFKLKQSWNDYPLNSFEPGHPYLVSAFLKTEGLSQVPVGKEIVLSEAFIEIAFYRTDGSGKKTLIPSSVRRSQGIKGARNWTRETVEVVAPIINTNEGLWLEISIILHGSGKFLVDDIELYRYPMLTENQSAGVLDPNKTCGSKDSYCGLCKFKKGSNSYLGWVPADTNIFPSGRSLGRVRSVSSAACMSQRACIGDEESNGFLRSFVEPPNFGRLLNDTFTSQEDENDRQVVFVPQVNRRDDFFLVEKAAPFVGTRCNGQPESEVRLTDEDVFNSVSEFAQLPSFCNRKDADICTVGGVAPARPSPNCGLEECGICRFKDQTKQEYIGLSHMKLSRVQKSSQSICLPQKYCDDILTEESLTKFAEHYYLGGRGGRFYQEEIPDPKVSRKLEWISDRKFKEYCQGPLVWKYDNVGITKKLNELITDPNLCSNTISCTKLKEPYQVNANPFEGISVINLEYDNLSKTYTAKVRFDLKSEGTGTIQYGTDSDFSNGIFTRVGFTGIDGEISWERGQPTPLIDSNGYSNIVLSNGSKGIRRSFELLLPNLQVSTRYRYQVTSIDALYPFCILGRCQFGNLSTSQERQVYNSNSLKSAARTSKVYVFDVPGAPIQTQTETSPAPTGPTIETKIIEIEEFNCGASGEKCGICRVVQGGYIGIKDRTLQQVSSLKDAACMPVDDDVCTETELGQLRPSTIGDYLKAPNNGNLVNDQSSLTDRKVRFVVAGTKGGSNYSNSISDHCIDDGAQKVSSKTIRNLLEFLWNDLNRCPNCKVDFPRDVGREAIYDDANFALALSPPPPRDHTVLRFPKPSFTGDKAEAGICRFSEDSRDLFIGLEDGILTRKAHLNESVCMDSFSCDLLGKFYVSAPKNGKFGNDRAGSKRTLEFVPNEDFCGKGSSIKIKSSQENEEYGNFDIQYLILKLYHKGLCPDCQIDPKYEGPKVGAKLCDDNDPTKCGVCNIKSGTEIDTKIGLVGGAFARVGEFSKAVCMTKIACEQVSLYLQRFKFKIPLHGSQYKTLEKISRQDFDKQFDSKAICESSMKNFKDYDRPGILFGDHSPNSISPTDFKQLDIMENSFTRQAEFKDQKSSSSVNSQCGTKPRTTPYELNNPTAIHLNDNEVKKIIDELMPQYHKLACQQDVSASTSPTPGPTQSGNLGTCASTSNSNLKLQIIGITDKINYDGWMNDENHISGSLTKRDGDYIPNEILRSSFIAAVNLRLHGTEVIPSNMELWIQIGKQKDETSADVSWGSLFGPFLPEKATTATYLTNTVRLRPILIPNFIHENNGKYQINVLARPRGSTNGSCLVPTVLNPSDPPSMPNIYNYRVSILGDCSSVESPSTNCGVCRYSNNFLTGVNPGSDFSKSLRDGVCMSQKSCEYIKGNYPTFDGLTLRAERGANSLVDDQVVSVCQNKNSRNVLSYEEVVSQVSNDPELKTIGADSNNIEGDISLTLDKDRFNSTSLIRLQLIKSNPKTTRDHAITTYSTIKKTLCNEDPKDQSKCYLTQEDIIGNGCEIWHDKQQLILTVQAGQSQLTVGCKLNSESPKIKAGGYFEFQSFYSDGSQKQIKILSKTITIVAAQEKEIKKIITGISGSSDYPTYQGGGTFNVKIKVEAPSDLDRNVVYRTIYQFDNLSDFLNIRPFKDEAEFCGYAESRYSEFLAYIPKQARAPVSEPNKIRSWATGDISIGQDNLGSIGLAFSNDDKSGEYLVCLRSKTKTGEILRSQFHFRVLPLPATPPPAEIWKVVGKSEWPSYSSNGTKVSVKAKINYKPGADLLVTLMRYDPSKGDFVTLNSFGDGNSAAWNKRCTSVDQRGEASLVVSIQKSDLISSNSTLPQNIFKFKVEEFRRENNKPCANVPAKARPSNYLFVEDKYEEAYPILNQNKCFLEGKNSAKSVCDGIGFQIFP